MELGPLVIAYCEELACFVLSPPGTAWAEQSEPMTPSAESLADAIQAAICDWLIEHQ